MSLHWCIAGILTGIISLLTFLLSDNIIVGLLCFLIGCINAIIGMWQEMKLNMYLITNNSKRK